MKLHTTLSISALVKRTNKLAEGVDPRDLTPAHRRGIFTLVKH